MQAAAEFHAAQKALLREFSATVYKKDSTAWRQWRKFCKWMGIPADLQGIRDNIPFLKIFSERVIAGLLGASRIPIKKRSVEQYLCYIEQIFAAVGDSKPWHNKLGQLEFRTGQQLSTYAKQDPPPTRVRPISVSVLQALDSA